MKFMDWRSFALNKSLIINRNEDTCSMSVSLPFLSSSNLPKRHAFCRQEGEERYPLAPKSATEEENTPKKLSPIANKSASSKADTEPLSGLGMQREPRNP